MPTQLERLKKILAVPTYFRKEHELLRYIVKILKTKDYTYNIDAVGNLYITKGEADVYPCVSAHTDSVQPHSDIEIHEITYKDKLRLIGRHSTNGYQCGIGADDKAGVFVCLELLEELPVLKVALFSGEEFGCVGSHASDAEFFKNVGYVLAFDCPGSTDITHYCNGIRLFDENSEFYAKIKPILVEIMGKEPKMHHHPYTDVWQLKCQYPISCINIATGYHQYHLTNEYVVVDEVINAVKMGKACIEQLGCNQYQFLPHLNELTTYDDTLKKLQRYYARVYQTQIEPYENIMKE